MWTLMLCSFDSLARHTYFLSPSRILPIISIYNLSQSNSEQSYLIPSRWPRFVIRWVYGAPFHEFSSNLKNLSEGKDSSK